MTKNLERSKTWLRARLCRLVLDGWHATLEGEDMSLTFSSESEVERLLTKFFASPIAKALTPEEAKQLRVWASWDLHADLTCGSSESIAQFIHRLDKLTTEAILAEAEAQADEMTTKFAQTIKTKSRNGNTY